MIVSKLLFYGLTSLSSKCLNCKWQPQLSEQSYFIVSFSVFLLRLLGSNSDVTQLKKELDDLVDAIVGNFFEPEKNKLQPKPE